MRKSTVMLMSFVPHVNKFTFYQEDNQIDSILLHSSLLLETLFPNLGLKSHSGTNFMNQEYVLFKF